MNGRLLFLFLSFLLFYASLYYIHTHIHRDMDAQQEQEGRMVRGDGCGGEQPSSSHTANRTPINREQRLLLLNTPSTIATHAHDLDLHACLTSCTETQASNYAALPLVPFSCVRKLPLMKRGTYRETPTTTRSSLITIIIKIKPPSH